MISHWVKPIESRCNNIPQATFLKMLSLPRKKWECFHYVAEEKFHCVLMLSLKPGKLCTLLVEVGRGFGSVHHRAVRACAGSSRVSPIASFWLVRMGQRARKGRGQHPCWKGKWDQLGAGALVWVMGTGVSQFSDGVWKTRSVFSCLLEVLSGVMQYGVGIVRYLEVVVS